MSAYRTVHFLKSLDIPDNGYGHRFRTGIKTCTTTRAAFFFIMGGPVTHSIELPGKIKNMDRTGIDTQTAALTIVNPYQNAIACHIFSLKQNVLQLKMYVPQM
jgi:hypothetical protein